MIALAQFYGIDTTKGGDIWPLQLCIALCDNYISGFEVAYEQKAGRPKKWDAITYSILLLRVEKLKLDLDCTTKVALKQILIEDGKKRPSPSEIRGLGTKLSEARNPNFNPLFKSVRPTGSENRYDLLENVVSILSNTSKIH